MLENDEIIVERVIKAVTLMLAESRGIEVDVHVGTMLDEPPLSMDSLDYVSMMVKLEDEFGIIASDEDFAKGSVATVGDVAKVVRRLQA